MRISWIDRAKGIGLLLVILGHLTTYEYQLFNWVFGFHMPLFFFLSGYVYRSSPKIRDFIKSCVMNLGVPYIFFVCVGWFLTAHVFHDPLPSLSRIAYESFYQAQPESLHVGQLWFLACLAGVMTMFENLKKWNLNAKGEWLVVVGLSFLGFAIGYAYDHYLGNVLVFGKHVPRPPLKLDSALVALPFFYLGHRCKSLDIDSWIPRSVLQWILIAITLISMTLICGPILNGPVNLACNRYQNAALFLATSLSGIMLVVVLAVRIGRFSILEFLGKNSLPIFAGHSFFLYLYAFLLSHALGQKMEIMKNISVPMSLLGVVFVTCACLPLPVVYHVSVGRLIGRFKRTHSNAASA